MINWLRFLKKEQSNGSVKYELVFRKFFEAFNANDALELASDEAIDKLEKLLGISLPADIAYFINQYGNVWTPDILSIIDDNDVEMNDIKQFWLSSDITDDKLTGYGSQIDEADIIAFASDSMGNLFCFKADDIRTKKETAVVYFFDLDFQTLTREARSFTDLIAKYNTLIGKPFEK